jgi:signal recognition particle subunit SRP54
MQAVRKMGPMSKILGMMPGMGQYKDQIGNIDEREIDRIEAIIYSMTPAERANPDILNGSRRSRIAKGSGTTVSEVNGLVTRFAETRKMMSQLGAMGGLGLPGVRKGKQAPQAKKKNTKGVSGNPLKRAQQAAAASAPPAAAAHAPTPAFDEFGLPLSGKGAKAADPFGLGGGAAMDEFQLPPELAKMFDQGRP